MLAIHDQFTHQNSDRLKTTCIGLGLVRLLQDAKRFEEAKATLYSLETSFQGGESEMPSQRPSNRPNRITRSRASRSTRIEAA
jgi:hypothetical protein